jgi:hypothetical protein
MAGLVPAIHVFNALTCARQQMLVTRGLDPRVYLLRKNHVVFFAK